MIGTRIGRYELLHRLAAGGMGEIYLAREEASDAGFGSLVAIKVLLQHLGSNQTFVRMFLDEARVVAKLRHEHIVKIRDIAQQRGQYYMVMEYIRGQNLRELLGDAAIEDRPLLSPRLGAQVFADLANALAVVHREGLVHRDLSPNNIMISDEGIPKLIDFGVVRALGTASLTNPGTLKGKFGYMAPEYIRSQVYDHRVDLFSLGVVMWETFTRERLFQGTNAADQLHRVLDAPIPRLDERLPDFPIALADLIARTLQRDPERRIPTAVALADQLADIARSQPLDQHAPTLRKWLEQRIGPQIAAREHVEHLMMALPAGAAVPEIPHGLADSRGADSGSYDLEVSAARPRMTTAPTTIHNSGTSMRLANGEVVSTTDHDVPGTRKRTLASVAAAVALVVIALVAVTRGRAGDHEDSIAPAVAPQPRPQPAPSQADVHRERGIKAMADHDYAKAISEFADAMRGGGGSDLVQLMELARRLQHDAIHASRPPASTDARQTK